MASPKSPRGSRSPLVRYAPLVAVVVVIAIVAVVIGIVGSKKTKKASVTTNTNGQGQSTFSDVPIFYNEAKDKGTVARYTWPNCDGSTGTTAIPILLPPPCTPAASAASAPNAGATSPGVTATTIKVGYFAAKPDPTFDALLRAAAAYDAADRDRAGVCGLHRHLPRRLQPVRTQGPTREDQWIRLEHRRGRGEGRRRHGRRRRGVRGDGRSRTGAEL